MRLSFLHYPELLLLLLSLLLTVIFCSPWTLFLRRRGKIQNFNFRTRTRGISIINANATLFYFFAPTYAEFLSLPLYVCQAAQKIANEQILHCTEKPRFEANAYNKAAFFFVSRIYPQRNVCADNRGILRGERDTSRTLLPSLGLFLVNTLR